MIELFVFDLGNVILPFNHHQIATKLFARSNGKSGFTEREIFDYLFNDESGCINPYEEGSLSSMEFFLHIRDRCNLRLDFDEFTEIWNNIFWENREVSEIITHLKARGMPVFLLSNTNELHFCHVLEHYPIIHSMDEWILSFEVGAKKPDKRMYDAIFERSDVSKENVLYVDDVERYITSARQRGIQGHVFRSASDLRNLIKDNFDPLSSY
jgi:glucose-1-phosphatase